MSAPRRGRFITLEGVDGAGKSTHVPWLAEQARARGHDVIVTREPGGTSLGEELRRLLLHAPMSHDSEALLMFAARREHLDHVIRPALARGAWVVCDRFTDATFAYQCGGHGVSRRIVQALGDWMHADCEPDVTFLFDVAVEVARERLVRSQTAAGASPDKFEREAAAFFDRVRAEYLARAAREPGRFRVIDGGEPVDAVRRMLAEHLAALERTPVTPP
jgi:dTMP kinase